RRDWGHARDYVRAMWLMLQHNTANDYVVASGEAHSVGEFVEAAFAVAGVPWQKHVKHSPAFDRPVDPVDLVGSPAKIKATLDWSPQVSFDELVREMVEAEVALISAPSSGTD
ncbi:MAG TPA: GDP-mannose 4,6-dehydratase, partial [Chthoniobacterales bacterium]|nr:GDP-mannose 4,6-dehydratase [Chthoniobacterales bacterium]